MSRPTGNDRRYHSLDLWRGLICLLVVLEHAGVALWSSFDNLSGFERWLHGGIVSLLRLNLGAPLFFVLGGYCIASSIDSSRRKGTSPWNFLARRLWRIFPPYWAALAFCLAFVAALDVLGLGRLHGGGLGLELASPANLSLSQWVGNLTLSETWRARFWSGEELVFLRPVWSNCYQEQFYIVCFLVLLLAPRRLFGALAAVTVAIVAFRAVAYDAGASHRIAGTFPVRWHEFAVGLTLYWRLHIAESRVARRAVECGLAGLFVLAWWIESVSTTAAAGLGLALIASHRWDVTLSQLDWLAPLRACGHRSYSIYLIHLPICTVGNTWLGELGLTSFWARVGIMIPIVTIASVGVAWAFHRWIEARFIGLPSVPRALMTRPSTPHQGAPRRGASPRLAGLRWS